MNLDTNNMEAIVAMLMKELKKVENKEGACGCCEAKNGVFHSMDEAIAAAKKAQATLFASRLELRERIVNSIRETLKDYTLELAELGVSETGMGRVADKKLKHEVTIAKTPGVEDLKAFAYSGDDGLTVMELSPYGVIGAITPSTNPSETIICNSIGMIAAGNAIVFAPHPGAKRTSIRTVELINEAVRKAGGPENLVVTIDEPSIENTNKMMENPNIKMLVATGGPGVVKHPGAKRTSIRTVELINEAVRKAGGPENLVVTIDEPSIENTNKMMENPNIKMLVATGGPGVVKSVMSSGKKAIGAGAGNPPVLVDETADIEKAAKDIVAGCSFDNNLPCIAEKEVVAVDSIADYLIFEMQKNGAYLLKDEALIEKLVGMVLTNGSPNRSYVGRDAKVILKDLGIQVGDEIKVILAETTKDHPFAQKELLMPILPVVRVKNALEGIEVSKELEHGLRHTAMIHSKNIDILSKYAREMETTILVKNGPSYAGIGVGGEGHTTFTIAGPTREMETTILVKNGPSYAGIGVGGEGHTTFTIAGPTGEGLTSARSFARNRRCVLVGALSIK